MAVLRSWAKRRTDPHGQPPRGWTHHHNCGNDAVVGMKRLDNADGFVVTDLDGLDRHGGVARCAPKVLADSTWLLARCATYQFASLGWEVGGASVGINAPADSRAEAIAAAVAALADPVAAGLALDAGRGLTDADLAPLHAIDGRPAAYHARRDELTGIGVAAAAASLRPLDGATIAIESLDAVSLAFARAATARGARVVAVARAADAVTDPTGIDPDALAAVLADPTKDALASLAPGATTDAAAVTAAGVDIVAIGSKMSAVDHNAATAISAGVVVPTGWVPVTTRALAVLTRQGVSVVPDFIALAGAATASGLGPALPGDDDAAATAAATVSDMMAEVLAGVGEQWNNPVLAACARAEAFLTGRGHDLPTTRPLG
jgi:glutamate dehydrogenase (NAD(P)+)